MDLSLLKSDERVRIAGQATYGMSNLRPADTGLSFVVFISQRDDARHAARIKWSPAPKVKAQDMGSYAINPFEHKAGPRLPLNDERQLEESVKLNLQVLADYWNGDIEYTQDAVVALKKV